MKRKSCLHNAILLSFVVSISGLPALAYLDGNVVETGRLSASEFLDDWCFYKIDRILCWSWSDDKHFINAHPQLLRHIDKARPTAYGPGYEGYVHKPGYFDTYPEAPDHPRRPLGARMKSVFDLLNSYEHLPEPGDFLKTVEQEAALQEKVTDSFIDYQSLSPKNEEEDLQYLVSIADAKLLKQLDKDILSHQIQYLENGWHIEQEKHILKLILERASRIDLLEIEKTAKTLDNTSSIAYSNGGWHSRHGLDGEYGDWYNKHPNPVPVSQSTVSKFRIELFFPIMSQTIGTLNQYLDATPGKRAELRFFLVLCGLTDAEIAAIDQQCDLRTKELSVLRSLQTETETNSEPSEERSIRAKLKKLRYLLNNWNIELAEQYYSVALRNNPNLQNQLSRVSSKETIPIASNYSNNNEVLTGMAIYYQSLGGDSTNTRSTATTTSFLEFVDLVEDYVFSTEGNRATKLLKLKQLGLKRTDIEKLNQQVEERDRKLAILNINYEAPR